MSDFIVSLIRTWVPIVIGGLVSWLVALGVDVPDAQAVQLAAVTTGLVIGVYYTAARALERRFPAFGLLLGTRRAPSYTPAEEG